MPPKHAWERPVGSGRAVLALRADWQQHLKQVHRDLGFRHVRFHPPLGEMPPRWSTSTVLLRNPSSTRLRRSTACCRCGRSRPSWREPILRDPNARALMSKHRV
ncbi:MAG: hypothetical protein M3Q32_04105 [Pseudomonadota bacterium]|nr:hypothetical protein [Pseudomonadota bacterium]